MNTTCGGCIFFQADGECAYHGRLNVFRRRNEVETVDGLPVVQRVCTAIRDGEWKKYMEEKGLDLSGMVNAVDEKLTVQADILVDGYEATIPEIQDTVNSAMEMSIKPKTIIVGISSKQNGYEVVEAMEKILRGTGTRYIIIHIVEKSYNENKILSHMAMKARKPYIAYFYAGDLVPESLMSELYRHVNIDMRKLIMIRPFGAGLSGLVINRNTHIALRLDDATPIMGKVEELINTEGYNLEDMVMEWAV